MTAVHAATISVQPASSDFSNTTTLMIDITGVSNLFAFQFDVGFDPPIVSAIGVTEGSFLPTGGSTLFIPGTIDNVTGVISNTADALTGLVPGVSGSGTLAKVQFQALAPGTSAITLSNVILLDSSGAAWGCSKIAAL